MKMLGVAQLFRDSITHNLKFHTLGNADCIRILLDNGRKILVDYADTHDASDKYDLRCDLPEELRSDLGSETEYDVVVFTHLDRDHYAGSTDFFYFDHIAAYQGDVDGYKRISMKTMWVPAAIITEELSREGATTEAKAIQKEARERFKANEGIRVFSRPDRLEAWCKENGISLDDRRHLLSDAGTLVPGFTIKDDGVEIFVHSPFATRQDDNSVEDRNEDAIAFQMTFDVNGQVTKAFFASDIGHEGLAEIVKVTESKKNQSRLEWDVFKLPHHCSHGALSGDPREGDKSDPDSQVRKLFETYGQDGCVVVSTSKPIPAKGSKEDRRVGENPPHRQAANYFKEDVVDDIDDFLVTMEHPTKTKPKPLVIEIDNVGATVTASQSVTASVAVTAVAAPRAGCV